MSENMHSLAAAYALDSLTDVERRRFDTHLNDCDTCADEVHGMCETVTGLATAAAQEPPEELRERVLAQAARTRQRPPRVRRPGSGRTRTLGWMLSAACLVLAVVLGFATLREQHTREKADKLNREIAAVMAASGAARSAARYAPAAAAPSSPPGHSARP